MIKVGDVVRVTSDLYPGAAREGTVVDVRPFYNGQAVTIISLWNNKTTFSTERFKIEVLSDA